MCWVLTVFHLFHIPVRHDDSIVGVGNPADRPGSRPEWKSLSLPRTVNTKIQQPWIITLVFSVLTGPSCDCNLSSIYLLQFFLEHSLLLSACRCFYCCKRLNLIKQFPDFWKISFMLKPLLLTKLVTTYFYFVRVAFEFFLESLHCKSSSSCFISCVHCSVQNITFASIITLESFPVIWLCFLELPLPVTSQLYIAHQHFLTSWFTWCIWFSSEKES